MALGKLLVDLERTVKREERGMKDSIGEPVATAAAIAVVPKC